MNVGPYCPVDPNTTKNYVQYFSEKSVSFIGGLETDGVFFDNIMSDGGSFDKGNVDIDGDNVPDRGNGPSGHGWFDGSSYVELLLVF
jgi:hypothetical protein